MVTLKTQQSLIKKGAQLDLKDKNGQTPLHIACRLKHTEIVNKLIEAGANRSIKNNIGHIPRDYIFPTCDLGLVALLSSPPTPRKK